MDTPRDLRNLLNPYKGQWVALSPDEKTVLGHGNTMEEAIAMAKLKDVEIQPVLIKVPTEGSSFILV